MPPKNTSASVALSERDHQAIIAAFKHNKNAFEIDYEGYAATLGLASAASGRTNWANLRKKLGVPNGKNMRGFLLFSLENFTDFSMCGIRP